MWGYVALAGAQLLNGYQQAEMIRKNAKVQQSINDMNAQFAELDAFNAEAGGQSESARYQQVADSVLGEQRNAMAASNVDVNYGTAAAIQADTKATATVNILEIQRQAREKALGYKMQAINTKLGSAMQNTQAQMDASSALTRGIFGAAETGLKGYERAQSTGVGEKKNSGDSGAPQWRGGANNSPKGSTDLGWYPDDAPNGRPGFFGHGARAPELGSSWRESY